MTTLGVVLITHNHEKYLEDAIQTVIAQTVTDWEMVVVEDGSTDGTYAVAQREASKDERIRVVQTFRDGGPSYSRNFGFPLLPPCEFVMFLDGDDYRDSRSFEKLLSLPRLMPDASFYYGVGVEVNEDGTTKSGRPVQPITEPKYYSVTFRDILTRWLPCHPSGLLMRYETFARSGGFDERIWIAEDMELFLRLAARKDACYLHDPVFYCRRHADSLTRRKVNPPEIQELLRSRLRIYGLLGAGMPADTKTLPTKMRTA